MTISASRSDNLNIRIKPEIRDLIDRAARAGGKNRSEFILDAARRAAEEALSDRTVFKLGPEAFAEFAARLDAPAMPNERLRQSLRKAAAWDPE